MDTSPISLDILPGEMITHILSFLPEEVQCVCKYVKLFNEWLPKKINSEFQLLSYFFHLKNLEGVKWAWKMGFYHSCNLNTISDQAVFTADMPVLKWMISVNFPFSHLAPVYAIKGGHLHVIKWFIQNGSDINILKDMYSVACQYGHLDILKWYEKKYKFIPHGPLNIEAIIKSGKIDTVKWLFENRKCVWKKDYIQMAVFFGHAEMSKYFESYRCPYIFFRGKMKGTQCEKIRVNGGNCQDHTKRGKRCKK